MIAHLTTGNSAGIVGRFDLSYHAFVILFLAVFIGVIVSILHIILVYESPRLSSVGNIVRIILVGHDFCQLSSWVVISYSSSGSTTKTTESRVKIPFLCRTVYPPFKESLFSQREVVSVLFVVA